MKSFQSLMEKYIHSDDIDNIFDNNDNIGFNLDDMNNSVGGSIKKSKKSKTKEPKIRR